MAMYTVFEELMLGLEKKAGLQDLLSEDGKSCSLEFDEGLIVDIGYNDLQDSVLFFAILCEIDPARSADLHTEMLKANYLFLGTNGPALGVEPGTGQAALSYQHGISGLTIEKLEDLIEGFVVTAQTWAARLGGRETEIGKGEDVPEGMPPGGGIRV